MTVAEDFLTIIKQLARDIELPRIRSVHMSVTDKVLNRNSKFGAIVLEDGTVGLTYVDLDNAREGLRRHARLDRYPGESPDAVAMLYGDDEPWKRVLGFAAVNAISQFLIRDSGLPLGDSQSTMEMLAPGSNDQVGMVGYFPPLVRSISDAGVPLTVIELDPAWLETESPVGVQLTMETARLDYCNKILCTGTTLINHTIDSVLTHCQSAEQVILLGPTVSCLPDPLFARGVTTVAGRQIVDSGQFTHFWEAGEPWRDTANRYMIDKPGYPGFQELVNKLISQ